MGRLFNYNTDNLDIPIYEGYDNEAGGIMACAEAYEDMLGVYEAMADYNSICLALEGAVDSETVSVLEAKQKEAGKNIFQRMLETLKRWLGKIVTFFKRIKEKFKKKSKTDEEFFKKNEDIVNEVAKKYDEVQKEYADKAFKKDMDNAESNKKAPLLQREMYEYKELLNDTHEYNKIWNGAARAVDMLEDIKIKGIPSDKINELFNSKEKEIISAARNNMCGDKETSDEDFVSTLTARYRGNKRVISVKEFLKFYEEFIKKTHYNSDREKFIEMVEKLMTNECKRQIYSCKEAVKWREDEIELNKKDAQDIKSGINVKNRKEQLDEIAKDSARMNRVITKQRCRISILTKVQTLAIKAFNVWKSVLDEATNECKKFVNDAIRFASMANIRI